jgi:hypothetical protein
VSFPNFQYEIIGRDPNIRCELIQPVNETVGGIPVQKKAMDSSFDSRIQIGYDVSVVVQAIKIIHVIDKRDHDFVDFGIPIITKLAAWIVGADLESEKIIQGHIYVSSDIQMQTKR